MKKLIFFVLLIGIFLSFNVLAENRCCEKTTSGDFCIYTDSTNCQTGYKSAPTSCEQTNYCQLGCGISESEGRCYKNVPKALIDSKENSTWIASPNCDIPQCKKGCCTLSSECSYTTQTRCKMETSNYVDLVMDFDSNVESETACLDTCRSAEQGCCVKGQGECIYGTRSECGLATDISQGLGFQKDTFCSDTKLNCDCAPKQKKGCLGEDVYWFDSCGNPEEIADDCDYISGTICRQSERNASCVSVNCNDVDSDNYSPNSGGDKKNGESWCLYEGPVGYGRDLVGSRHYRSMCINGEEILEECQDFREEICVQGIQGSQPYPLLESFGGLSGDYIEASCRQNRFQSCSSCNPEQTLEEFMSDIGKSDDVDAKISAYQQKVEKSKVCCNNFGLRDCLWIGAEDYGKCAPQVPAGQNFWGENELETDQELPIASYAASSTPSTDLEEVCSKASADCKVTFAAGGWTRLLGSLAPFSDDWECINNCHCLSKEWIKEMSTVCVSSADCGANYNYKGTFTNEGFTYLSANIDKSSGKINSNSGLKLSKEEVLDFKELTQPTKFGAKPGFWSELKHGAGWVVILNMAASSIYSKFAASQTFGTAAFAGISGLQPLGKLFTGDIAGFKNLYRANAGQYFGTSVIDQTVKLGEKEYFYNDGAWFDSSENIISDPKTIDKLNSEAKLTGQGTWAQRLNTAMWVYTLYELVDALLAKEKTTTVSVSCMPWQAPDGGSNCETCNLDKKGCTMYKCKSLGKNCELLNQGSGNETCVQLNKNDVNAPIINAWSKILTAGYTLTETTSQGNPGFIINEKIEPFTPVTFGVNTNEPAQCKISLEGSKSYDDMPSTYLGNEFYVYNHSITFGVASEESLEKEGFRLVNGGNIIAYVRCKDANGNSNNNDYFIKFSVKKGPDLTPPTIEGTSIKNNAFMPSSIQTTDFRIYLNEQSSCRWDFKDLEYENLNNTMTCLTTPFGKTSVYYGLYECQTTLSGIKDKQTTAYYFRCNDQAGNKNGESLAFSLHGTEPLEIRDVAPSGKWYRENLTLKVATEKGAEFGKANCAFSESNMTTFENMILFYETNATVHSQFLTPAKGVHTFFVMCKDTAGNEARISTTVDVTVDVTAPQIKILYKGATLFLQTDEESACEYKADERFEFGEGTIMTGDMAKSHEASLGFEEQGKIYYLKCKDIFDNIAEYVVYP